MYKITAYNIRRKIWKWIIKKVMEDQFQHLTRDQQKVSLYLLENFEYMSDGNLLSTWKTYPMDSEIK